MNRKQRRAAGNNKGAGKDKSIGKAALASAALAMAERLQDEGKRPAAADIYRDVLAADPDNLAALYNLGFLLNEEEFPEEAEKHLARFLRLRPDDARALAGLAGVKINLGLTAEAVALADRAAALAPSSLVLSKIGAVYNVAGRPDDARKTWTRAQQQDPDCVDAYLHLQRLAKFSPDDPLFRQLLALRDKSALLQTGDRTFLEFTLGQAFLDQDEPEQAFAHYAAANRLKRSTYPAYDIARTERMVEDIIRIFNEAFIEKHRSKGEGLARGGKSIFIVGMPRSGSTLTERILSSHPDCSSVGESQALPRSLRLDPANPRRPASADWMADHLSAGVLEKIAQSYLSAIHSRRQGRDKHVVDKMLFNFLYLGLIRLALPQAKILHCTRDPVDIGLSIWQSVFEPDIPWAYDMREIGRYYRAYAKVMDHWKALFPDDIYTVNYETLVANQEEETRKLLRFCGLPWNDRCLRFHENDAPVNTASTAQVRRPLYKDSARKWKKHEKHLGLLIEALGDIIS